MIATKTAADFNADAARHEDDARESFDRCDTDGFLSQWASGVNAQVARKNALIAENGGVATFWAYRVFDLDGRERSFRRANTRYGFKLVVETANGEVWIDPEAKRPATNRAKGCIVTKEEFVAPAHARTWSPPGARGLSGCTSVQVVTFPDDHKLKFDGLVGAGDLT